MKAIDQFEFYQLGYHIHALDSIQDGATVQECLFDLYTAGNWLDHLVSDQLVELVVARGAAAKLLWMIRKVVPGGQAPFPDLNTKLEDFGRFYVHHLKEALREFETVFAAELRVMPSYLVRRKGIYQTDMLIEHAEQAFTAEARKLLPDQAAKDFREAGRCIAFELPTAAAFHVMRVTESVLREYHAIIKKLPPGTKSPDMAVCINEIKAAGGNKKVTAILDQIRDLHRNPTMHPDEFLSMDEALALFDVAKSAIAAMIAEIAVLKSDTTPVTPESA